MTAAEKADVDFMEEVLFPQLRTLDKLLELKHVHSTWNFYWQQMVISLPVDYREAREEHLKKMRKHLLHKHGLTEKDLL